MFLFQKRWGGHPIEKFSKYKDQSKYNEGISAILDLLNSYWCRVKEKSAVYKNL